MRHIYGYDYVVPESAQPTPWRFHLNLHIAADKYLFPTLSGQARTHFEQCASIDTHVDNVHAMIRAINSEVYHDQDLTQLAEKLRRDNLGRLIRHPPYRVDPERDRIALWKTFDELVFAADLVEKKALQCPRHGIVLNEKSSSACSLCSSSGWGVFSRLVPASRELKPEDQVWFSTARPDQYLGSRGDNAGWLSPLGLHPTK